MGDCCGGPAAEDGADRAAEGGPDESERRVAIRERYATAATGAGGCCGCGAGDGTATERALARGYDAADVDGAEAAAELSLGCGNPTAIADLDAGETVLDLGSGAGFDCFLAAEAVAPGGTVLGVDMTPEMVERARANAESVEGAPVEFRLGEIEHLPVADGVVDVVLSNCVVNLSPDKPAVLREAFRVLAPGGRLAISDVVRTAEPPADHEVTAASVAACVAGASTVPALRAMLTDAGFEAVTIEPEPGRRELIREWDPDLDPSEFLVAATVEAEKPRG